MLAPRRIDAAYRGVLTSTGAGHQAAWRIALIAACVLSVGIAASVGHPAGYLEADPALAHLLRGMALIKGLIVLGAAAAALWRHGWAISPRLAVLYALAVSTMAGSTMLIWQLTFIPLAALLFHVAMIGMVFLGWRDRLERSEAQEATHFSGHWDGSSSID